MQVSLLWCIRELCAGAEVEVLRASSPLDFARDKSDALRMTISQQAAFFVAS
jgi:hypothetical protein